MKLGFYVVDFNRFSVSTGTLESDFYLDLKSDRPVSINDIELMNGNILALDTITDTPLHKQYRVLSDIRVIPDLRRYPFDRSILSVELEPKFENENEMVFAIDPSISGIDPDARLPGWEFTGTNAKITNKTYLPGEIPYSRAIFETSAGRDAVSTILKFFLPILLIVAVSLFSLLLKITSRLGLTASMLLAAVMIHWRVADSIPLVAYTTFLDLFMIITYATLVIVLVSGILILFFTEKKDTARVDLINHWSIRLIPSVSLSLYFLLFLSLTF